MLSPFAFVVNRVDVHLNAMQTRNCLSLSDGDRPKSRANYTGERLKMLRPETYREVVRLLAEPREHVSYREICRQCHVTDDTVKAVEQREAVPIAARKQELMMQAARIAKRAADRVEDEIDNPPLPQAVVAFGVMTDKISLLSNNDPARIEVQISHTGAPSAQTLHKQLIELARILNAQPANPTIFPDPLTLEDTQSSGVEGVAEGTDAQ
jgi:hypothetical protein